MAANIDYEIPTWNQIYDMLLSQAQKIQIQKYKPDIITGIARGGLVPARILTDLLESPELSFIQVEFYTDINQTHQEPTLKQPLTTQITGKKALLVDDIADTGESLKLAKTHLQQQGALETKTATLYTKPQSITTPDFYEKQTTSWVVFPWDTKETLRKIIQKQQGKRALNQEVAKLVKAGLPKQLAGKLLKNMQ
ncbi:MAG: phosphoribosyltransferase [Chloroflexi bacterium]|nr:phosphoribosyltransferase [Chloroflexota bacterium]